MGLRRPAAACLIGLLPAVLLGAGLPDPAPFDAVLEARARNGGYDYRGTTGQDKKRLAAYLSNLGDADPARMAADERKAFWINAYNAWAIQTLLDNPGKKITDVAGAFDKSKHRVGGEGLTLDEIENRLREMKDARIHFAIVCASKSCPPLASRAYRAEGLSEALDRQARDFVNDRGRNSIDRNRERIALSMIFKWNRKEFERDAATLKRYVSTYLLDPAAAQWLGSVPKEPEFLEYDWAPNQP
jgi:hypothetical protein